MAHSYLTQSYTHTHIQSNLHTHQLLHNQMAQFYIYHYPSSSIHLNMMYTKQQTGKSDNWIGICNMCLHYCSSYWHISHTLQYHHHSLYKQSEYTVCMQMMLAHTHCYRPNMISHCSGTHYSAGSGMPHTDYSQTGTHSYMLDIHTEY